MLRWNSPINTQCFIEDTDTSICLWVIELITLILEHCRFREDGKAMGKSLGDEELAMDSLIPTFSSNPPYERNPDFTGSSANMIF